MFGILIALWIYDFFILKSLDIILKLSVTFLGIVPIYFNTRFINKIDSDLYNEPLTTTGIIKNKGDSKAFSFNMVTYILELEGIKDKFQTDFGFVRRTHIGDS